MVRIIGYKESISNEGKVFNSLILQGGVEIIHSASGNLYATARKANLASAFDEATCQSLVGTELAGSIEKEDCEPYEYTSPQTGEVLNLFHRYVFIPEEKKAPVEMYRELTMADLQYLPEVQQ